MGLVGEISDILRSASKAIRKGPEVISSLGGLKPNMKSMTHGVKDSTFQFPCLISDTISLETATTTTRVLDRKYAELTQSWLSLNSMFDVTIDPTPVSYLKKFHTNINFESVNNLLVDDDEVESIIKYCTMKNELEFMINTFNMLNNINVSFNDILDSIKAKIDARYESINGACNLDYYVWLDELTPLIYDDGEIKGKYDKSNRRLKKLINELTEVFHCRYEYVNILIIEMTILKREAPIAILNGETFNPLI